MINIEFFGPFSWTCRTDTESIFIADIAQKSGVYIWTIKHNDAELIYYVGETGRSFSIRMLEHFKEHMSGAYHLYQPDEFRHGGKVMVWPGRFDTERKTTIAEFLENYSILYQPIEELARLYRFFVAPLECERRLRERIEACLAKHLYAQEGVIGEFQDKGIKYHARLESETPMQVTLKSSVNLLGVPASLSV